MANGNNSYSAPDRSQEGEKGTAEFNMADFGGENVDPVDTSEPDISSEVVINESDDRKYAGKFKSVEELERSYQELQRRFSQRQTEQPVEEEQETQQETPIEEDTPQEVSYGAAVDAALTGAGLSPQQVAQEYQQNGQLTEESYQKLANAGFSREVVDSQIKHFESSQDANPEAAAEGIALAEQVKSEIGGDKPFNEMISWAQNNLSASEIDAYNADTMSGDPAKVRSAVKALHQRFKQSGQQSPFRLLGKTGAPASGSPKGFASMAEQAAAAMEAYDSGDPAKVRAYEARAIASNF